MRANHLPTNRLIPSSQYVLALLLVALVWMQFVGIAHRYVHPQSHHAHSIAESKSETFTAESHAHVFPMHEGATHNDVTCQLFDLVCADVSLVSASHVLPILSSALHLNAFAVGRYFPSLVHTYQARAPPALI